MDVLEEALELFKYCLDFYEEWRIAQRKLKKEKEKEEEIVGDYPSMEKELFAHTLQRHVGIAKKCMLDLYADFDLYVIDKNRNPFVMIRPGKKNRKIRFGSKRYPVDVDVEATDVFTLFDRLASESFSKKELEMLNKLYRGTVNICRLQDYMNDVKDDPPSEKGEEVVVEMETNDGRVVRGVLTYSPHATLGKELDDHLEAINTCKNLSGIEMYFINEIEFGLKIIVAKLKRMKSPYITAIQNVVKISEIPPAASAAQIVTADLPDREEHHAEVVVDVPHKRVEESVEERGAGDSALWTKRCQFSNEGESLEMKELPFADHPEAYESDEDRTPRDFPAKRPAGRPKSLVIPPVPNFPSSSKCCIQ